MDRPRIETDHFRRFASSNVSEYHEIRRVELQAQVDAFLKSGGTIQPVEFGVMTTIERPTKKQARRNKTLVLD